MTRPTPEYLIEVMTQCSINTGHQRLKSEGYQIGRDECQRVRKRLICQGVVKTRTWTDERIDRVRALVADGKKGVEIAAILGVSTTALYDLFYKQRIIVSKPKAPPPPRDELEAIWLASNNVATADHYNVGQKLVARWVKHYGLKRPKTEKKPRIRPSQAKRNCGFTYIPTPVTPPTETGPLADAARYLRQQGYANVYRRGRDEWQVGAKVMSEKDMLARVDEMKARRQRLSA